ncbi:MAG: hypothetical protein ACK4M3_03220 [Pyrobaculum sp.]
MRLSLCRTRTVLDYRPVVFLDDEGYVEISSKEGRRVVAKVVKGPCVGVSREVAYFLYPYYGWDILDIDAEFLIQKVNPPEATRVVMKVPFGIGEAVVRRQLAGFPIYEGTVALEYLEHIEFGEVAHVEPQPFSILTDNTRLRLVETPVEDTDIIFTPRRRF